ncbi:F-box/LRR-repeat protein At5g02910-like [Salvia hispanica]|uniref:F-box/LRR-repeat protein At5g02910-like n=1 Tax=Salvia hispanica TaxID=49212 RepID=UPI002009C44B|nr:F-box/LRR-repeat protein At5g02910-like [Salvia hispanica]
MDEDKISQFPNEILQHILSFIDIHEAVETTILSKRWKHLWRSLLCIRLHIHGGAAYRHRVSQFLSHRDAAAAVHDFHLSLDIKTNLDTAFVEECVLYAINHNVQSLRLQILRHYEPFLGLPAPLLVSETLLELEIRQVHFRGIYLPRRFSLPNLKTLCLERLWLFDDHRSREDVVEPFAGLPELEKLYLCEFPITDLVLRAPKLRVLEIVQYSFQNMEVAKEISAPLLTSFRYEGHLPLECSKMNLPMLEKVHLDIHHVSNHVKGMHLNCVRMLQQLGKATVVSLTLDTLKVLELDGGPIEQSHSPFRNLKCLKLVEGRRKIRTVLQSVMNYLTVGTLYFESMMVEFPDDVVVVEQNSEYMSDEEDTDYTWGFDNLFRN